MNAAGNEFRGRATLTEKSLDHLSESRELLEEIAGLKKLRQRRLESLTAIERKLEALQTRYAEIKADAEEKGLSFEAPARGLRYGGVKMAILERLYEEGDGMESGAIARMLSARFGENIHAKSYLTILKRLSDAGLATKEDSIWRLTEAGRTAAFQNRRNRPE